MIAANLIGTIDGGTGFFVRAVYATFREVFPQVYLFPAAGPERPAEIQNIVLVALNFEERPVFQNEDARLDGFLKLRWTGSIPDDAPVLTDDFAPVDNYTIPVARKLQAERYRGRSPAAGNQARKS